MSLVTLKEILAPANEKNYAVAAFDTMDFTLTEGIIEAAEQTGLPVILMLRGFAFDRQEADVTTEDYKNKENSTIKTLCK